MGVDQQPGIVGLPVGRSTGPCSGNIGKLQGELDAGCGGFRIADNAPPDLGAPAVVGQQGRRHGLPHFVPPQAQQARRHQKGQPGGDAQQAAHQGRSRRKAGQEE